MSGWDLWCWGSGPAGIKYCKEGTKNGWYVFGYRLCEPGHLLHLLQGQAQALSSHDHCAGLHQLHGPQRQSGRAGSEAAGESDGGVPGGHRNDFAVPLRDGRLGHSDAQT